MKQLSFLNIDEALAILVLVISIFLWETAFFAWLGGPAITYLFMCVAFRKYEAILPKHK